MKEVKWELKDYEIYSQTDHEIHPDTPNFDNIEMSFRPNVRNWWMDVAGWRCQYEWYDEKRGWQKCKNRAKEVHHIIGEAETLQRGEDPNQNTGLPLCKSHHTRNPSWDEHSENFSFHPDMGQAQQAYKEWKRQMQHFNTMTGRRRIPYEDSPFAETHREHVKKASRGERYIAGTPDIDQYYIGKMQMMASEYVARTGKKKPDSKEHPDTDRSKKYHWTRWFYEGVNEEDYE